MIPTIPLPGETRRLRSPIGIWLEDDLTGNPPYGWVRAELDTREGPTWQLTDTKALVTPSGVLAYPALGRSAVLARQAFRWYRVRLTAQFYEPVYPPRRGRSRSDGIRFLARPYNDTAPPNLPRPLLVTVTLRPAATYPFPPGMPVLRGKVIDHTKKPLQHAQVFDGVRRTAHTDARGEFALPLPNAGLGVPLPIDVDYDGRRGTINVVLPGDLATGHTITI